MDDEKLVESLRGSLIHDAAQPLTDGVVDAFLAGVDVPDAARSERVRCMFVSHLLADVHSTPVRHIERPWSFGRWIEAIRKSVGLTRDDIALTLRADISFIERIEECDVPPWTLKLETIADLVCLFRLHIAAVEQLFLKSEAVLSGQQTARAAARSSNRNTAARSESARRALDLYLAANSAPRAAASALPLSVLSNLRVELEKRGAVELLGASE